MKNIVKLNSKSAGIVHLMENDKKFGLLYGLVGDIEYENQTDCYAFLVCAIVGQMLSNKVADVICKRLRTLCDENICVETISKLSADDLRGIGLSYSKAGYIKNLTDAVINNELDFKKIKEMSDSEAIKEITKIKGLGNWSAKMLLIFVLDRQNILPFEDGAFQQSYCWLYKDKEPSIKKVKTRAEKWEPYCSIVARYLYKALDQGHTTKI